MFLPALFQKKRWSWAPGNSACRPAHSRAEVGRSIEGGNTMRLRTVTMRPGTGAEEKRDRPKRQANRARLPRYVFMLATVLALGCLSAKPQSPRQVSSVAWSPDGTRLT